MNRIFLLVCHNTRGPSNPVGGGLDPVLEFMNARPEITNWLVLFQQIVLLKTTTDSKRLTRTLSKQFPHALFLLTEIKPEESNGRLPEDAWDFISDAG